HKPSWEITNLDLAHALTSSPQNFCNIDWEDFNKELSKELDHLGPPTCIHTQGELDMACIVLTESIQKVISTEVPIIDLGIKAK
ncbi:hypothetical protein EI94DRAFT_1611031, partial [Lactarius quietus]